MRLGDKSLDLSPEEFERATRRFFDVAGIRLDAFETNHREKIKASDETYEIDVAGRFEFAGGRYLTLVECKKQNRPVEREVVQVLFDRLRATGAQKAFMFSTGGF